MSDCTRLPYRFLRAIPLEDRIRWTMFKTWIDSGQKMTWICHRIGMRPEKAKRLMAGQQKIGLDDISDWMLAFGAELKWESVGPSK